MAEEFRIVLRNTGKIDPGRIDDYLKTGGYKSWEKALRMSPEKVIEKIIKSGLRGRGGTGLNTGQKWLLARRKSLRQKYFLCTAIEGEPGINKDRVIIENDPQYSGRYAHWGLCHRCR